MDVINKKNIWIFRIFFSILGFLLFISPFAIIPRLTNQDIFDIHSLCTKMPINSFFEGFVTFNIVSQMGLIFYFWLGTLLLIVGLIIFPIIFGRYWCGWLCPAGFFTEYLNKIIPKKLQIPFHKLDGKAIRYGFFTAFLLIPVFGLGSICCAFCNFNIIQGIFGLASFNPDYLNTFATRLGWITLAWILIFGVFSVGGRGYCNLFCPPGILSSIFHYGGSKFKFSRKFKIDKMSCDSCGKCESKCPMRAINSKKKNIDYSACIACHVCQANCPSDAIFYGRESK